ncbi:hypothetical protein H2248_011987 [Termitomyces sp. 'cryptogamus']|nr:hypothetical protein H2248_011987 [Termitomyces sp. 'cryptogamus']
MIKLRICHAYMRVYGLISHRLTFFFLSTFATELASMLLDAILETHAWAAARPKHESSLAAQNIENKIVSVMNTENEQGMFFSHPRLSSWLLPGIIGRQYSLRAFHFFHHLVPFLSLEERTILKLLSYV